jgi:hypothetical protein
MKEIKEGDRNGFIFRNNGVTVVAKKSSALAIASGLKTTR